MQDLTTEDAQIEKPEDAGKGEAGEVNRFLMEIELAGKTEKEWRKKGQKAIERFRDEKERKEWSFNVYWANVETIMPLLYSTPPKADIRRRFKDADPVGRIAAEVLERAVEYSIDAYDFDEEIESVLYNYCIPSRGVARVRFEPEITESEDGEGNSFEEMTYARTYCEHVPWDRFRRGPGFTWKEVPWIAYEHQLTRGEVDKKFPGFGSKVDYDVVMEGVDRKVADSEPSIFKRVRVWEIWDKQTLKVRWLAPSCITNFLAVEDDKLNLEGFFDCPRPLYAVKTATTLVPQVEFELYRDQAKELDRVTMRIGKLVSTLKQRGIYDSTISEFKELLKAEDNEMIPTSTAQTAMNMGGLDKAIYMLPIEQAANILKTLLVYREQVKQTIFELTGLGDILRGQTDPDEPFGSQKLKAQTGGKRIQKKQREVQRFIRDLVRKKTEIIAENYTPQVLSQITDIQLPFEADKQAAQMQIQQAQLAAQQTGQTPQLDPKLQAVLQKPSWEQVMQIIQSDALRRYRIDIETDSTIAADQEAEREQVTELVQGIGGFMKDIGPAVENGVIDLDSAKKILLSCLRRFKLGREVEDVIEEGMDKPPPQKPNPEAAKAQAQAQIEQQKMQAEMQLEQFRAQNDAKVAQAQQQAQAQQDLVSQQAEAARKKQEMQLEHESDTKKLLLQHQLDIEKLRAEQAAKLQEIGVKAEIDRRNAQEHEVREYNRAQGNEEPEDETSDAIYRYGDDGSRL